MQGVWPLIDDDGIVIADDYDAPDVRRAIVEFCRQPKVFGLYNRDAPWPEAVIVKTSAMRDRALAAHPSLVVVPPPG